MRGAPPVAMRDLVAPDLRLNVRSDRPADLGDHHKTRAGELLGAAKGTIGRYDAFHGVADMLNFGERSQTQLQPSSIGIVVGGRRRGNVHT